jgi:hypothetical protein
MLWWLFITRYVYFEVFKTYFMTVVVFIFWNVNNNSMITNFSLSICFEFLIVLWC